MSGIVAENGKEVTDEMVAEWEGSLEQGEWPSGWANVGDTLEGRLPKTSPGIATLTLRSPTV